jgi:hypothetical protein
MNKYLSCLLLSSSAAAQRIELPALRPQGHPRASAVAGSPRNDVLARILSHQFA